MSATPAERVARCRQILDRATSKTTEVRVTLSDFRVLVHAAEGFLALTDPAQTGNSGP